MQGPDKTVFIEKETIFLKNPGRNLDSNEDNHGFSKSSRSEFYKDLPTSSVVGWLLLPALCRKNAP